MYKREKEKSISILVDFNFSIIRDDTVGHRNVDLDNTLDHVDLINAGREQQDKDGCQLHREHMPGQTIF